MSHIPREAPMDFLMELCSQQLCLFNLTASGALRGGRQCNRQNLQENALSGLGHEI